MQIRRRNFGQLLILIAIVAKTNQNISNQSTALSTATLSTFDEFDNFGPLTQLINLAHDYVKAIAFISTALAVGHVRAIIVVAKQRFV